VKIQQPERLRKPGIIPAAIGALLLAALLSLLFNPGRLCSQPGPQKAGITCPFLF
jgi:hypothetical protein